MRKLRVEEMNRLSVEAFQEVEKNDLIVVLDDIRSMHNVGSVLRTADAFLCKQVILCGITPRPPHREIRKTAIGAEESVDWRYAENAMEAVTLLKNEGYQLLAVEQAEGSTSLPDFQPQPDAKYALIVGHEIDGVKQEIIDLCDICLEIPQFGTKHSLNVSVATGIAMFHLTFR
jgi:tRNA G18 (ribose-2'-O)-methylase SpoU